MKLSFEYLSHLCYKQSRIKNLEGEQIKQNYSTRKLVQSFPVKVFDILRVLIKFH